MVFFLYCSARFAHATAIIEWGFRGRAPIKKQSRQGFDALSVP